MAQSAPSMRLSTAEGAEKPLVLVAYDLPRETLDRLATACTVIEHAAGMAMKPAQAIEAAEGIAGIVCRNSPRYDATFFEALPRSLRVISQVGVGYDNVDIEAATAAGVMICNTPG